MRLIAIATGLALASGLAGCSTVGGGTTFTGDGLKQFLTDPNCAHHDSIEFATTAGGMPAYLKGSATRDCAGPAKQLPPLAGPIIDTIPAALPKAP